MRKHENRRSRLETALAVLLIAAGLSETTAWICGSSSAIRWIHAWSLSPLPLVYDRPFFFRRSEIEIQGASGSTVRMPFDNHLGSGGATHLARDRILYVALGRPHLLPKPVLDGVLDFYFCRGGLVKKVSIVFPEGTDGGMSQPQRFERECGS